MMFVVLLLIFEHKWNPYTSLIQSGLDLSPIITHHFKIDDFQAGFDAMRSGLSGKVILDWE
ncbi:hypothetical protein BCU89_20220 [Vibrio splendidus]|nr:hypothetical protein BCU89_20220 [Vibrio splendidus]